MDRNTKIRLKNNIKKNIDYHKNHNNIDFDIFKMSVIFLYSTILFKDTCQMQEVISVSEYERLYKEEISYTDKYFTNQNIHINLKLFDDEFILNNINFLIGLVKDSNTLTDEILAWAYQYFNEGDKDNQLSNTQFFTERYMTKYLIDKSLDSVQFSQSTLLSVQVIDPACGGGNFLVYVLEALFERCIQQNIAPKDAVDVLLSNIFGYDLDKNLAIIASINLKIKAHRLMIKYNDVGNFNILRGSTNIYCSLEENFIGSLDKDCNSHYIRNVETNDLYPMSYIIGEGRYDFVFTNPPFQGVKGMLDGLKNYLKEYYPNSKCDLCNAFIERTLDIVKKNGICGIVTQSSWMFLDSYSDLRKKILEDYSILDIVDLGSNSFYDLSGEKANVALVIFQNRIYEKGITNIKRLKSTSITDKIDMLERMYVADNLVYPVKQKDFYINSNYRFDYLSFGRIKESFEKLPLYGEFAKPMQGTSTGDSSKFIDYHWKHSSDEWILVSKGGSYCKWNGLNIYKVLWGNEGEFIKKQQGSALRNVKYFNDTSLVFSDTGTSGLSVRLLKENQIFVASGPGIRDLKGDKYAHIALLNSRLFSYFIRILSPKLTIAAGYISGIPTVEHLLYSEEMSNIGRSCCELKDRYLQKRVINSEFKHDDYQSISNIDIYVKNSIVEDLRLEFNRLENECKLENIVMNAYEFSSVETQHIYEEVGKCAYDINTVKSFDAIESFDRYIYDSIDNNCDFKKTKSVKSHLGIEGILESLTLEKGYSPVATFNYISENIDKLKLVKGKYIKDYFHKLILFIMGFGVADSSMITDIKYCDLINRIFDINPELRNRKDYDIETWILNEFNNWHSNAFRNEPVLKYDDDFKSLICLR